MASQAIVDISAKAIDKLPVSEEVKGALRDIQAEVADAYRQGFVEMVQAIKKQESVLDRIHATLAILVKHLAPQLEGQIPAAIRVASEGEAPDLASAVVVADPIGTGYSLSQSEVATALGISPTDVSSLIRAFKLSEDGACAVVVRKGKKYRFVNYHVRALDRFRELVRNPPAGLDPSLRNVLARARKAISAPK
jgi:DNA-binding transcriptional regulator GbsR (MarR family)